jgi:hypothetical protein
MANQADLMNYSLTISNSCVMISEDLSFFPYLKAYKLACHKSVGIGRTHATPGSEMKATS